MKFSILMINYNNDSTLERAIQSVLTQDYPDIELICVDDASTDSSRKIIKKFEKNDRFTAVYHEKNSGMTCGRLSGIERASGDYVLFLDSDDMLLPNCCSTLAEILQRKKYDMVLFGTEVEYTVVKSEAEKASMETYLKPLCGELDGEAYRHAFYIDRSFWHTIGNKCYSMELVRKTAAEMHRDYINLAEDFYFNFISGQFVNSYFGTSKKLLLYFVGSGVSTTSKHTLSKLIKSINSCFIVIRRCREFIQNHILGEPYSKYLDLHEQELILGFFERSKSIHSTEREDVIKLMLEKFGAEKFILTLAECYRYSYDKILSYVDIAKLFPHTCRPAKTVALYYYRLYNGGVENVISKMSMILTEAGYRVIVITDEEANPMDYPLAEGVKRICLGRDGYEPGTYALRFRKLRDCILDNDIDVFINNAWVSDLAELDLCTVKSTGCAYVVYCHVVHIAGLIDGWKGIICRQAAYRYADGIVTLSAADRIFWLRVNRCVFEVINPLPDLNLECTEDVCRKHKHELLWVGRVDDKRKNPADALEILYLVLQRVHDVSLRICGHMDKGTKTALLGQIEELGIGEHVILDGYKSEAELSKIYSNAGLLLHTADSEGFCMAIAEAMSFGLPVVCYELPYMTMTKRSDAVINVSWHDTRAAADAVVDMLQSEDKWLKMSEAAIAETKALRACNLPEMWKKIIDSVSEDGAPSESKPPTSEEFWEFCSTAELAYRQVPQGSYNHHNEQVLSIYNSKRYKLGSALLYFPAKIRGGIWCLRNRGVRYTASLFLKKAENLFGKVCKKW